MTIAPHLFWQINRQSKYNFKITSSKKVHGEQKTRNIKKNWDEYIQLTIK